ncbi:MAG: N-acetyltransferase, partial [Leptolyngbya sp. SIO1D8]|nr:N-acetyltransferase [Leptolyngbya sp. SIO1D8]
MMTIREALDSDLDDVLLIERAAFGSDEEAELVRGLLTDPSAKPLVSLLAFKDDQAVGHILFTAAHLMETQQKIAIAILAPLAIVPAFQKQGIGGQLIQTGLQLLSKAGVALVFVLGYPDYYSRHGFAPAHRFG